MSQPIHTPGPVEVIMETDHHVDGTPFKDYFIVTSGEKSRTVADTYNCDFVLAENDRHANARLLAAAFNAFDSAGTRLRCNAVELAERMQEGGISDLVEAVQGLLSVQPEESPIWNAREWKLARDECISALAKVKAGAS